MIDFNRAGPQRAEQMEASGNTETDPVSAFLAKMAEYGLNPGVITLDGKLTRFDVDKRGDKAGWYTYFPGEVPAGAFGSWKDDLKETWCYKALDVLTWEQRAAYSEKIKRAREERDRQEHEDQQRAKETANRIWRESLPISSQADHPYLLKKNIQPHHTRISRDGDLVVPEIDEHGEIWSLQFIKPDGEKKFLPFGRRDGLFFEFLGGDQVYLGEGFATCASIAEATGATVICAFNAGSLPKVARVLKRYMPGRQIIVAADNDQFKPDKGNAGIAKANEAAKILGNAPVVFPTFRDLETKPTDFNDLALLDGPAAVVAQLGQSRLGSQATFPPLGEVSTRLRGRVITRPKPKEFLWTCHGGGYLPRGVVGVLAATGGTGKTFFLLSLAVMTAAGKAFGPIESPRAARTLVICGEDDQEEVERRLWDITDGDFPEYLHAASVYGSVGPFMELDHNRPVRSGGFYWLEETIQKHPGLELLIIDPKSRFYGLDENNNDHATQWIQSLEYLGKHYDLTILFSSHTSDANSGKISQKMNRGASAIVDGCRWQAGLVRMNEETAESYGIDRPRDFIILDTPKNNYAADVSKPLYFKRSACGALHYCDLRKEATKAQADLVLAILKMDGRHRSRKEWQRDTDFVSEIKDRFKKFNRENLYPIIDHLIEQGKLIEASSDEDKRAAKTLQVVDVPF